MAHASTLFEKFKVRRENLHEKFSEMVANFRRKRKEEEQNEEAEVSSRNEREEVHGALRDQYRQF